MPFQTMTFASIARTLTRTLRMAAASALLTGLGWTQAPLRDLPDLGLILNDDGDYSFLRMQPDLSRRYLEAGVDALRGTPIRTLVYCVGAGSDVLYYPTQVANVWGWRRTKYDDPATANPSEPWGPRIERIKAGMAAGIDPIRVAGERARHHGLYFIPTYRMNDDHFMFDPFDYPLTGEFWLKNHERLKIGDSPILSDAHYGNLFDFTHAEVREYRLAIIREIIGRYQDLMDGLELDFNRVQVLFPRGKAAERAHLVTELLAEVRRELDVAAKAQGRPMSLLVRIPPTPENCAWAGLDWKTWVDQGLVDVLLPSQLMTLAHDLPIAEFVEYARPRGCRIVPSLYPITVYTWPFSPKPAAPDFVADAVRPVTPELARAAATNYLAQGASGFEFFNYHHEDLGAHPYSDRLYRIFRDLESTDSLRLTDKVYAITPAFYLDHENTYEYRKQVPVEVQAGRPAELRLPVYEDPAALSGFVQTTLLRVGIAQLPTTTTVNVQVKLNGATLFAGDPAPHLIATSGRPAGRVPTHYLVLPVASTAVLRRGDNALEITMGGDTAGAELKVMEVQLAIHYRQDWLNMLFD